MFQHLQVAYGFIMCASALIIIGLISLILYKLRNLRIAEKKAHYLKKHRMYIDYVIAHLDADEPLKLPSDPLSKWDLEVLQEQLIEMAERMKGTQRERLSVLFEQLGLPARQMRRLTSRFSAIRIEAAYILGAMGSSQAVPSLFALLEKERDEPGRFVIARAIARCARDLEDLREMINKMAHLSSDSPRLMAEILTESRLELTPLLKECLDHTDSRLVQVAIAGLDNQVDQEVAGSLWKLLRSQEKELRIQAAKLLLQTNLWVTPEQVKSMFNHQDWEIRAIASKAIGRWGEAAFLPLLIKVMDDSNWWVRRNAANSMIALGDAGYRALCEVAVRSRNDETVHLAKHALQEAMRSDEQVNPVEANRLRLHRHAIYQSYFAAERHQAI